MPHLFWEAEASRKCFLTIVSLSLYNIHRIWKPIIDLYSWVVNHVFLNKNLILWVACLFFSNFGHDVRLKSSETPSAECPLSLSPAEPQQGCVDSQTKSVEEALTTDEGLGESVGNNSQQTSSEATGEGDSGSSEGDDSGIPPQAGSSGHSDKPMVLKLHLLLNGKQVSVIYTSLTFVFWTRYSSTL